MPQLWFNAWQKITKHPVTGKLSREVRIESEACASYDDAMQELEDYSDSWRKHGYEYFGAYCHELDAITSNTTAITFHDELMDDLDQWVWERERDAREYREAATLSAHQLCDVGRSRW